jgi:quercetin dioxygenase-like cupin family protein
MAYINFNERKKVKIWEGITARLFHSDQIIFGYVTLEKGADVLEHSHVHEQWTLIIEGEMMFNINGEQKLLTNGMARIYSI